ncbi:MAG: protein-L-isoaspartate(D-aspartate) O-methyltransferase [candidate division KSB1 bacterium]|nr:protein-L-isoaspartate(D-aspartate) O-methyltransferase [candidate division KSB1 bacterium]
MIKIFRLMFIFIVLTYCRSNNDAAQRWQESQSAPDRFTAQRYQMVQQQIAERGVRDTLVLNAMRKVPRHLFVPNYLMTQAYIDSPLPIGEGQTISQPYIVAFMTEALKLKGNERVLEIGTGSGYQAAILAEIAKEVYTIEIVPILGRRSSELLQKMGYKNIHVIIGDGYRGLVEKAPFDAIIVTAAPDHIPQPLVDQLKAGGRLIIPVGNLEQELILIEKKADGAVTKKSILPVRFVPMTGEAQQKQPK